jgi:hydrogenase maturation protease
VKTIILGCGNPDRGDDAAGLVAARKLREMGMNAHEHTGDMLSLFDRWAGYDEVIIIDAMISGAQPGAIQQLDPLENPLASRQFHSSTHAFGLAEVIELARSLGRLPPKLTVYGIEAADCKIGAPLSPEVTQTVQKLVLDTYRLVTQTSR